MMEEAERIVSEGFHLQTSQGGVRCEKCLKPMFKVTAFLNEPARGVISFRCHNSKCGHYNLVDLERTVLE